MMNMFKKSAIGNMFFVFFPFVLMIIFAFLLSLANSYTGEFIFMTIVIFVAGFGLFFCSKILNFKQGRLISFGTRNMTKNQKKKYYSGYALMFLGTICALVLTST